MSQDTAQNSVNPGMTLVLGIPRLDFKNKSGVSSLVGEPTHTPGNSLVQAIPRYDHIPAHRINTRQKSHGRTRITARANYGPVRSISS